MAAVQAAGVPEQLQKNWYWGALLYILLLGPFDKKEVMDAIDFKDESVDREWLLDVVGYSSGQTFMVQLALSLYSNENHLPEDGLADMQTLDPKCKALVMGAMALRFGMVKISE